MRISDWSSDVCSSDLQERPDEPSWAFEGYHPSTADESLSQVARTIAPLWRDATGLERGRANVLRIFRVRDTRSCSHGDPCRRCRRRSEENTSELQSLMRISYAVFCLKKNTYAHQTPN